MQSSKRRTWLVRALSWAKGVCLLASVLCAVAIGCGSGETWPEGEDVQESEQTLWSDWQYIGAPPVGMLGAQAAVASWDEARLDVFVRGGDNALWHRAFANNKWYAWTSLGGIITSDPAAVSWQVGRIDVFAIGQEKAVWHRAFVDGQGWYAWNSIGGNVPFGSPAVASWGPGRLDVFARGGDGQLVHKEWNTNYWGAWEPLGGGLASSPAAISTNFGRIDVFVAGLDYKMYRKSYSLNGGWTGWTSGFGDNVMIQNAYAIPAVSSWNHTRFDLFAIGSNYDLKHNWNINGSWGSWEGLGGPIFAPSVVSWGTNRIDIFAVKQDNPNGNELFRKTWFVEPGCGAAGQTCCGGVCNSGNVCANNVCNACGGSQQACCDWPGNKCGSGLTCQSGLCKPPCGELNQACCNGSACISGTTCQSGVCKPPCGGSNEACCNGTTCGWGLTCQSGWCKAPPPPPCGGLNQGCCNGITCSSGLTCQSGWCKAPPPPPPCGGSGESCCSGACDSWNTCVNGTCQTCGAQGGQCCPYGQCQYLANSPQQCNIYNTCEPCGGQGQICCGSTCNGWLSCNGGYCW
jgi:hypothetical protein